jgi:hypothetical protein
MQVILLLGLPTMMVQAGKEGNFFSLKPLRLDRVITVKPHQFWSFYLTLLTMVLTKEVILNC